MKIHIVCYEDVDGWILGKIASKLRDNVLDAGFSCDISKKPDLNADINHHIIYYDYDGKRSTLDTVMITHIDTEEKLKKIRRQLWFAKLGICFSSETVDKLVRQGIRRDRLAYILPAHDEVMRPRQTVIGLTGKIHSDGRKRETMLVTLAKQISAADFSFKIMGMGWEQIVAELRELNFQVEYHDAFNYELNQRLVPSFDYYLYLGNDEGAMGFIDALAAGVKTIVTPQGYHLDAINGITHPFVTEKELVEVFEKISLSKRALTDVVKHWTWRDFALKHIEVWDDLLNQNTPGHVKKASIYQDGLGSMISPQIPIHDEEIIADIFNYVAAAIEKGDVQAAVRLLNDCCTIFPNRPEGYISLSEILTALGRFDQAKWVLDSAPKSLGLGS